MMIFTYNNVKNEFYKRGALTHYNDLGKELKIIMYGPRHNEYKFTIMYSTFNNNQPCLVITLDDYINCWSNSGKYNLEILLKLLNGVRSTNLKHIYNSKDINERKNCIHELMYYYELVDFSDNRGYINFNALIGNYHKRDYPFGYLIAVLNRIMKDDYNLTQPGSHPDDDLYENDFYGSENY